MWISSNTNCFKQRKGPWNLVNFLDVQVSYIFIDLNANYCSMKKRNLDKYCNIPSIKPGYGGIMDSVQFSTDWLQRPPDLELMLEFKACKCSKTKFPLCQCLLNNFKCHLQTYETWTRMKEMLIYLEWRGWMITMKIPIQNEMLVFLGSIVSISYAYIVITYVYAPEISNL